jgi:DNA-directed RNA polymerase subunit RPC12/RpoP
MLVTGIKSKPVYAPLRADTSGRYHLMLAREPGGEPLLRVLAELAAHSPAALARTRVLYSGSAPPPRVNPSDPQPSEPQSFDARAFAAAGVQDTELYGDTRELLRAYRQILESARMGLRLYVAGPESFIGLAMQIALEFNLNQDEIRAEECGSRARRVRCVHCRETTEDVTTNVARCLSCGRWLLVRDHYSRRLAAYMGVMVDAEVPGALPEIAETFP